MDSRMSEGSEPDASHARLIADLDATRRATLRLSALSVHDHEVYQALVAAHEALQHAYQSLASDHARVRAQEQVAHDALRASGERFRATFERAPVGIAHVALDGRWLRVNQRWCSLIGYTQDELRARTFQELTHPQDLATDARLVDDLLTGAVPLVTHEKRYLHRDGSIVWVRLTVSLERTMTGQPDYFTAVMEDITARKAAEAALHRQEAQLAGIIDSAMDAIIAIDADQRIVLFNCAAENLFRTSAEEALGQPIDRFIPERFRAQHGADSRRFAATGVTSRSMQSSGTLYARRTDGTEVPIEATISKAEIDEDQHFTMILRDITARKAAEQAQERLQAQLADERMLLETVLRQLPTGVVIADALLQRVILVNERLQRIWGTSAVPHDDWDRFDTAYPLLHHDDIPYQPEERPLARALRTGETIGMEEIAFRRSDGTIGTVEASAAPIRDHTGSIVAGVAAYQDISGRKRAERSLHLVAEAGMVLSASLEVEPTLRALAQLVVPRLADLCTIDLVAANGTIRRGINVHADPDKQAALEAYAQRFAPGATNQTSPAAVAIRTGTPVFHPIFDTAVLAQHTATAEHRQAVKSFAPRSLISVPLRARSRILGALTLVITESGRRYDETDLRLATDLAGRAALAMDNAQLYEEAQEALRLRDEFLANAGHELRSPLAPLLSASQLLRDQVAADASLGESLRRWVWVISQASRRLRNQVESLIELGQIQAGRATLQPSPLDLVTLIRHVAANVEVGPKHTVTVVVAEDALFMEGDERRLEHVFTNLIQNAIKYSPRGGQVLVQVQRRENHVWVAVRDQGIGIPEAEQAHLFTRFYRASNTHGMNGLGIGLYLVHDIVRRHAGTVTVYSREGQGTTVTVRLPIQANTDAEITTDSAG